jgi:adenylate kinase
VLGLIKDTMLKEVSKGSKGFLIDGCPHALAECYQFEAEVNIMTHNKSLFQNIPPTLVLFFDVSEDTLVKRCLKRAQTSGRSDDNIETIKKRLRTYQTATKPVISHFEKKGKLVRVSLFS